MGLFGGNPFDDVVDDIIKEQRRAANRQARRVARGTAEIDYALRGYDDNYWADRRRLYAEQGLEQADKAADNAYERAVKILASRGLGTSSVADKAMADIAATALAARRAAANSAYDAVMREQSSLQKQRADMIDMLRSGMSPASAASAARNVAAQMAASGPQQPITGLADMFAGILSGLVPIAYAEGRGFPGLGWFGRRYW